MDIYPNRDDAILLCNGFSDGFYLQYAGPRISVMSRNLVSAEIHKTETLAKLAKEVQLGRILGPFDKKNSFIFENISYRVSGKTG